MGWPSPLLTRWTEFERRSTTTELPRFSVHDIATCGVATKGRYFRRTWRREKETASFVGTVTVERGGTFLFLICVWNGKSISQNIRLEALACRFGGSRWYAICPKTGRRAAHLYMGKEGALSRRAYQLAFDSQCEDALGRCLRRRNKSLDKLNAGAPGDMSRPKRMHKSTFLRLAKAVCAEEQLWRAGVKKQFGLE